ncbi:thylakoid membrane photosystem I accumulation factor [Gloeocapsopsis crepidinum LEGE 06123]|uniref:Thylakoid membrane photosystem I accumulation factor n=1 Tax=Gloeocapsopsis crepidinum LEGE 06123 TaxID=588587 RepID=A0ABR9UYC9_9CHRO|nr:thylakoid membrane photosystem I accumulation factor [Gloeocapsopsis crepidinum LEGE 06123]
MNFLLHFWYKTFCSWQRLVVLCLVLICCQFMLAVPSAFAGSNDDHFEGNVFVLYGGNASLVPPKVKLEESLKRDRPTLLIFYVDDSSDCKQYATVVTRLQAFYGRVVDFIPVSVDTILPKESYATTEAGYYYTGNVPQLVVFNQLGEVVLNETGQVPFEKVDGVFRELFDLLPRSESVELKRRSINEFSSELAE